MCGPSLTVQCVAGEADQPAGGRERRGRAPGRAPRASAARARARARAACGRTAAAAGAAAAAAAGAAGAGASARLTRGARAPAAHTYPVVVNSDGTVQTSWLACI